jgi:hypothetical protein
MSDESMAESLPREMARVRDEVMPAYREVGPNGSLALAFMTSDLDRAAKALADGNIVGMIHAYDSLKGYSV